MDNTKRVKRTNRFEHTKAERQKKGKVKQDQLQRHEFL